MLSDEFSTWKCSCLSINTKRDQSTPAPSTVMSVLLYGAEEYTWGFPHKVPATDTWYTLVGSCLQCTDTSAIWFINHWWHLTSSSTLISLWPCCTPGPWSTSIWCFASDGGYLRSQCPAREDRLVVLATSGWRRFRRMPTHYRYLPCENRQGSQSGATVHSDYATMMTMRILC